MEEQLLQTIQTIPWSIFLQLSIVAIIGLLFKKFYDNITSYVMFRSNPDLGKNVRVKINGNLGTIIKFNWKFIYIQLEENDTVLLVPITRWIIQTWEICKIK